MENINKKRKHTDELDDLFASSNEELVNTEGRTDIPELDHWTMLRSIQESTMCITDFMR